MKRWSFGPLQIVWDTKPKKMRLETAVYGWSVDNTILVSDGWVINGAYKVDYVNGGRSVSIQKYPDTKKAHLLAVLPKQFTGDYNEILNAFRVWYVKLPRWRRWWLSRRVPKTEVILPREVLSAYEEDWDDIPF